MGRKMPPSRAIGFSLLAGMLASGLEDEDVDDFANNAELPEWKQRCIRNYVSCQNEGWTGSCFTCLRLCEGPQEWPIDKCNERRK